MKTVYVSFDHEKPELMDKIEEHWRARAFCKKEKVLDTTIREWKAGNTQLILEEEVVRCLQELSQSD